MNHYLIASCFFGIREISYEQYCDIPDDEYVDYPEDIFYEALRTDFKGRIAAVVSPRYYDLITKEYGINND